MGTLHGFVGYVSRPFIDVASLMYGMKETVFLRRRPSQPSITNINAPPPPSMPRPLQLPLRIHQPRLDPHPIPPIPPDTLAIQQFRERALDLLIYIDQLQLFLFQFRQLGLDR
jgi:hypothetical protein